MPGGRSLIVFAFELMYLAAPPAGFEPALTAPDAASLYRADQRKHGGGRTGRARMGRGAAVTRALARSCRRLEPTAHAEKWYYSDGSFPHVIEGT